ncbi:MAG: sulfatase-like hydrolase/transferase [Dehalococcoidia bacterium]|nr:sulfatase-like hydrolase/transferase [Dehalococcoidia bacterium]
MNRKAPNILLITIDALRFDHLGCYGYGKDTSPNIDRLASKGTVFLEAISNGGNTPSAFPSLLASALPPLDEREWRTMMQRHTTLAELLQRAGYRTAAFHSNPYLTSIFSYNKGFHVFKDDLERGKVWTIRERITTRILSSWPKGSFLNFLTKLYKGLFGLFFTVRGRTIVTAEQISDLSLRWLKSHNDTFFLWIHYMDVHIPYMPPPQYVRQLAGGRISRYKMARLYEKMLATPPQLSASEVEKLKSLYDANIRYVDDAIGWLLGKASRQLENTIVIITADHGDEFGEHGKLSHQTAYDGIIHVPLIMTGPNVEAGQLVKDQVSLIDLPPTLADLVGLGEVDTFHGESLLPLIKGERKAVRGVISASPFPGKQPRFLVYRTPGWKYIRTESADIEGTVLKEELYDLSNDPGETRNLHDTDMEAAKRFELDAKTKLQKFKETKVREMNVYEKQRIKARVKKLGKSQS